MLTLVWPAQTAICLGPGAGGDPEADGGVAEVVGAERGDVGLFDGGEPDALTPGSGAEGASFAAGEDEGVAIGCGEAIEVIGKCCGDEAGEWDGAGAGVGLGWAVGEVALDLDGDLGVS